MSTLSRSSCARARVTIQSGPGAVLALQAGATAAFPGGTQPPVRPSGSLCAAVWEAAVLGAIDTRLFSFHGKTPLVLSSLDCVTCACKLFSINNFHASNATAPAGCRFAVSHESRIGRNVPSAPSDSSPRNGLAACPCLRRVDRRRHMIPIRCPYDDLGWVVYAVPRRARRLCTGEASRIDRCRIDGSPNSPDLR